MEINQGTKEQQHIVMLPFTAQGHLIPFLALANKFQQRFGFEITIATTQLNVQHLKSAIAKNTSTRQSNIHLFELPFDGSRHGLPPNIENTESLPLNQMINLCHATISLETPFRSLITDISIKDGSPPLCIISDVFMGWATEVARSCGTVNVTFTTGGAYGTAAYVSLWENLPHKLNQSDEFRLPGFPDSCLFHLTQLHPFLRAADGSRRPFIWVIRPPVGFNLEGEFDGKWLPEGFEERMKNSKQGLMVHGWAPQLEILCHSSTAAFVSHCGWNSTMESLSQGIPIIGWPLAAEQGYNAKLLVEEMRVCVELTRGTKSSLSKEDVIKVIDTVMGEGIKAENMKKKAAEIGELIRSAVGEGGSHKGSSLEAMDTFVSALISKKQGL